MHALGQLLPERFVMGLGASSHAMVEGWHGIPFGKPIVRVRETATMVRSMLRGEKSSFDLTTLRSHGYRQPPLENPPPIHLAALRPKMIEAAVEVGDGVIFNLWPKRALPTARTTATSSPSRRTRRRWPPNVASTRRGNPERVRSHG